MTDMISYFQNSGAAADGLHNRLSGIFWWAWNSNAGKRLHVPALDAATISRAAAMVMVPGLKQVDVYLAGVSADTLICADGRKLTVLQGRAWGWLKIGARWTGTRWRTWKPWGTPPGGSPPRLPLPTCQVDSLQELAC